MKVNMNPYKLKHIPTGLYYKPFNGIANLSTMGKIYQTKTNILTIGYYSDGRPRSEIFLYFKENSQVYKKIKDNPLLVFEKTRYDEIKLITKSEDWIKEEI